jgi:hypothetical protein
MKPAALRLAAIAVLFVGWIGYLVFLARTTANPVVLSRPQLLMSGFDVIAARTGDDSFLVSDVLYPKNAEAWKGKSIVVRNLSQCQTFSPKDGWRAVPPADGQKVLLALNSPLQDAKDGTEFDAVSIPPSPGYHPSAGVGPPRIYPDDNDVIRQYLALPHKP